MRHLPSEAFPDPEMHRHPFYAKALARIGTEVSLMPDGTFAIRRRVGGLNLRWLPAPRDIPLLYRLKGITLLTSPGPNMDRALQHSGAVPVMTPQHRARLDLSGNAPERRAAMAQKWRNRLNRAERSQLRVSHAPLPRDPDHWLLQREAAQRRSRGYRALPAGFALAWHKTQIFTAWEDDTPVAAMLFLLHAPGASYHIGWSGERGRALSAHNLLLARAADWLQARGYAELDLGTLEPRRAPGLMHFKLGIGAQVQTPGHSWLYSRAMAPLGRVLA